VQRARFEIIKISSNDNTTANKIANAEFTVILSKYVDYYGSFEEAAKHLNEYAEDEYDILKTDGNGHATSKLLAYGIYEGRETKTPSDEIETVEPFYINIDKNSDGIIKEFVENDLPFTSYLKLVKVDKKTGKNVTFSNTTFSLSKLNENTKQWEKVKCKTGIFSHDKWKTDKNAIAYTETKLEAGTYKADEILTPNGFLELEEPVVFKINRSNKTLEFDEDYDAYITVTIANEQPTGKLNIDKSVVLNDNVDLSLVDTSDLSKIKFRLKAKENIIDYADGSVIYEKGKSVKEFNLSKDGKYTIENLPMGVYELEEIETLQGLVLNTTPIEVKFEKKDNTTKVYTKDIKIENKPTIFEFSKTDVTGDKELVGAELKVFDENKKIVDSWKSKETTHKIEGLEVGKTYTLEEKIAPNGFVKATSIQFKVESKTEIQKVTMIDKIVSVSKQNIAGDEIEGAKLRIENENSEIVDSWTSTKEPHIVNGLEEGKKYILYEDYAPDGYVISNKIEFTVSEDKETQKITMVDKIVEISKTDLVTGEEVEGAELEVQDKETEKIIDKWTSTKEAHKVTGLEENRTYILREKTAPYGYETTEEIEFVVSENKETQKIEMKDMPILQNIKLVKIDANTKESIKEKFTFGLYEDEECKDLIKEYESNKEEGTIIFEDLRYGTFFVKEIKAPNGYVISDKVIKIEINDKGVFIDDVKVEGENSLYTFEFENAPIDTPKTGDDSKTTIYAGVLGLSLLTLVGLGVYEYKRKKLVNKK